MRRIEDIQYKSGGRFLIVLTDDGKEEWLELLDPVAEDLMEQLMACHWEEDPGKITADDLEEAYDNGYQDGYCEAGDPEIIYDEGYEEGYAAAMNSKVEH